MQAVVINFVVSDIMKLVNVVHAIEPVFIANTEPNKRHFRLCDRYANYLQIVPRAAMGLYGSCLTILIIYFMIANNGLRPTVCLYFIGFHEGSIWLLILLHIYNLLICFFVVLYIVPTDILVISAFVSHNFLSYRFENEITGFNEDLERGNLTPQEMRRRLKAIVVMYQEYIE